MYDRPHWFFFVKIFPESKNFVWEPPYGVERGDLYIPKNVGVKKIFKLFIHFTRLGIPWRQLEQWENLIKSNLCTGAPLGSGDTG